MKVYVVENDGYPEDRYILGIYGSKELAEKAIQNYQRVAGTSYLNEDFIIKEYDLDEKIEFYGDKGYHFDKNGRYIGEYDSFSIVNEKFESYVERIWGRNYRVHICVSSYDDDVYMNAWRIMEDYLRGRNNND